MHIVINDDTTFAVANELGDIRAHSELGLYHEDIRFVSRLELTFDGRRPIPLSAHLLDHTSSIHFATNPALHTAPRGALGLVRRRQLDSQGLHEDIALTNYADHAVTIVLGLVLEADLAHVFEVRQGLERVRTTAIRAKLRPLRRLGSGKTLSYRRRHGTVESRLAVSISAQPTRRGNMLRFTVSLSPRASQNIQFTLYPQVRDTAAATRKLAQPRGASPEGPRSSDVFGPAPLLRTDHALLQELYAQSVRDFRALRITDPQLCGEGGEAIAAGIPWFMALFGRDSLIAAYQALPFFPSAAAGTLRALARLQGTQVDPSRAEEPGKILHEHRRPDYSGQVWATVRFPYYGAIDATPLFLMVLAAYYEATRDIGTVRELLPHAEAALTWMHAYGDKDGDGYLEYQRESHGGLDNHGWKDSSDAIRFRDGRLAGPPIALCEAQGYAYAARLGMARIFDALGEPVRASRLRAQADALKERFNHDYWMPERGYFALALDGQKRQVDAIASNAGHLLWTGIADPENAALVAQRLLSPALFSGWGVRTMATTEGGYNPISYHCGSVWPHDNSLIALGLARYGYKQAAARITDALLSAGAYQADQRLPELYAGYSTDESPAPVEYIEANRPQAWATASVFLLLSMMAGVAPLAEPISMREDTRLRLDDNPYLLGGFLPIGTSRLDLDGVWCHGRQVRVELAREADMLLPERPTWQRANGTLSRENERTPEDVA